jgi:asparagine synthetase B (glutamine-hydrolysing)
MFAVKVRLLPDSAEVGSSGLERVVTFLKGNLRIEMLTAKPYAYYAETESDVTIGESLLPTQAAEIYRMPADHRQRGHTNAILDDAILSVVTIDVRRMAVTMTSSVCCSRPVYYCFADHTFYCSSSIRSLRALGLRVQADENAIPEFLVYRYVVPPRTLYRGLKKLVGGQRVCLALEDVGQTNNSYFPFSQSIPEVLLGNEGLDDLFRQQLEPSLREYPRAGVLLSGGADSGALAVVARSLSDTVSSVSSSFAFADDTDAEESYALSFARHLNITHHVYRGSEEQYLTGLVDAIHSAEEPVHHLQSVMLYLLFRNYARGRYDLLVCGEGADGLFGNDLHNFVHRYRGLLAFMRHSGARRLCRAFVDALHIDDYRVRLLTAESGEDLDSRDHILWTFGAYGDSALVKKQFGCGDDDILASRKALIGNYKNKSLLDKVTILSLLSEGCVSMYVWSKLAESQGIVIQYPFTTPTLVTYAIRSGWDEKLQETKYFVRSLLRQRGVPEELIGRPKLSFGFPYRYWALPGALFQPLVDMTAHMFDPVLLRSLQTEEPGRAMMLWNLINLFLWHKVMIEGVSRNSLCAEILDRRRLAKAKG